MIEAARELYLVAAVLALVPAVTLAGMPVLAQSAFVAVGGVGALQLERAGLPIGGAVLAAIALGGVAGALTGTLVARTEPAFVALATWALAWLAYVVLLGFPSLSGGAQGLTRPAEDRVETPFGATLTLTPAVHLIAAAVVAVLVYALMRRLRAGPLGLDALALRDDRELAGSLRVPVVRRTAGLLAGSGAAAAAAGAGIALALGVAAPEDLSPLLALQLLAAAIAGGRYPLLGAVVIVALARAPAELTAVLLLAAVALRRYLPERLVRGAGEAPEAEPPPATTGELTARGLHGALGGREILRGLDLELRPGEIHALIGPNGSGKTTAVRILAGALKPGSGTVSGGPLARTFQRAAGFPALTPHRQVLVAAQAADPVRLAGLWHAVGLAPQTDHDARAWSALALVGLQDRANTPPDELTAGQQRLLQIARALATQAPVLALDEPAVGMTAAERATLERVLRELAASGRAILVIEHDLRLVAALADTVTVLDDGRAIAHGPPETVIADATVQHVYLGVAAA